MSDPVDTASRLRRPLARKYFAAFFIAVVVPLLVSGASDAWFSYQDQRRQVSLTLRVEAESAASKIAGFLAGIKDQLEWAVHLPWGTDDDERHRLDALRLLRQVPAITSVTLIDGEGKERLQISRVERDTVASKTDRSRDPAVLGARGSRIWYGPVTFYRGSEPYMTMAVAGNRASAGVAVAEINLKLIWDVITAIRVGRTGYALVLDRAGSLVAHPNISLVLQGASAAASLPLDELRAAAQRPAGEAIEITDLDRRTVLVAAAPVAGVNWLVFVQQPLAEAFAPIRAALWRTGFLLLAGAAFAAILALVLARRMTGPIRSLEDGVAKIGAGQFAHRIALSSGDELERLAGRVNRMADELAVSQDRSERIARLKRFLAPQVAEIVERAGEDGLLDGQRAEVVVIFCDLRGFTAFSAAAEPEQIMAVLGEYYAALGKIIVKYEATLTSFSGDGLMLLVNAPVPCPDPALRAVRIAVDMQAAVQDLVFVWRARGYQIGFGVGLAKGQATVGRIGYEGRLDYTAIGSVTNLASRLCSAADDGQILIDTLAARDVAAAVALTPLGGRELKGFVSAVEVFEVNRADAAAVPVPLART